MPQTRLVDFLQDRAGNYLRAVGWYEKKTVELGYLRRDLSRDVMQQRLEEVHEHITWSWNPPESATIQGLGAKRASLQVREQAVILHLPINTEKGVVVGLEPEAAGHLTTFIGDCLDYVDEIA